MPGSDQCSMVGVGMTIWEVLGGRLGTDIFHPRERHAGSRKAAKSAKEKQGTKRGIECSGESVLTDMKIHSPASTPGLGVLSPGGPREASSSGWSVRVLLATIGGGELII